MGSVHMDTLAIVDRYADTVDRPGRIISSFGGTGYNIAISLAASGCAVTVLTDLGDDLYADMVAGDLQSRGIRLAIQRNPALNNAGFVAHIVEHDLQSAVSFTPVEEVDIAIDRLRKALVGRDAAIADTNHSLTSLNRLSNLCAERGIPLFIAGVSESKALKVADITPAPHAVFLNRREAYYLRRHRYPEGTDYPGVAGRLGATLVVTRDSDGVAIVTARETRMLPSPVTAFQGHLLGTGDVLMAQTIRAYLETQDWMEGLRAGLAASRAIAESATCNASPAQAPQVLLANRSRDLMTGLPNREDLMHHLQEALDDQLWDPQPLTVFFLDLNNFKAFNDRRGHFFGDQILAAFGRALHETIGPPNGFVARWGGDEFAGFVRHLPALSVRERLIGIHRVLVGQESVPVSMTLGVIETRASETLSAADILNKADHAMYGQRRHIPYHHSAQRTAS